MKALNWLGLLTAAGVWTGCGTGEDGPYQPAASSTSSGAVGPTATASEATDTTSGAGGSSGVSPSSAASGSLSATTATESAASGSTSSGDSGSSTGSSTAETGQDTSGEVCGVDACPFDAGLSFACGKRFALGVNYAWHDFGADFGGLSQWDLGGVTAQQAAVGTELAEMKANGVSVVRWWMFPDFRGDGVQFDAQDAPTGLSPTAIEDIQTALALADQHDLYVVFTIFSFDNFRPTRVDSDVNIRGITPLVTDATARASLIQNVVKPVAQAAATAPHASRLLGWDVINEPEWAVSPTGEDDQDFTPNEELDAVSLADMKALINETLTTLRAETPTALLSVGWAAAKWSWAFSDVTNVDFHQPHIYGWVNMYWPYTETPVELGYVDKPTVIGEFYMLDMPFADSDDTPFSTIVGSWYDNGYAGAWPWAYSESNSGPDNLPLLKAFADSKGCSVSF